MKDFVLTLLHLLEDSDVTYAIGGSLASSYYGQPRTTQDVDLSLALEHAQVAGLVECVRALGWYVAADEAARAVAESSSFSVNDGFWKADLFVVRDDPFDVQALARRRRGTLTAEGDQAWFLTPEDIVLHKLRWCGAELREKHLLDILAILHVQGAALDLAHITGWARELGAAPLWASVLETYGKARGE